MNFASPARLPFGKVRLGRRDRLYRSGRFQVVHLSVASTASSDSVDSRGSVPTVSSGVGNPVICGGAAYFRSASVQECTAEAALDSAASGHRIGSQPYCEGLVGSGSHTFHHQGLDLPGSSWVSYQLE